MDDKEFRGWLEKQEQPLCVLIATRAALRVFPLVRPNSPNSDLAFLTARAILTSGVAANSPTPNVIAAARAAADAAYSAYSADAARAAAFAAGAAYAAGAAGAAGAAFAVGAADAAYAAARAASAVDAVDTANAAADAVDAVDTAGAAGAAYVAARAAADADAEINFETLTSTPIWHDPGMPEWLQDILDNPSEIFDAGPTWSFWRDWYQGFLDGKPLDWELQRRVALIPDEDWEKGPEHIAALIEEIQAEYLAEKAPLAETVEFDAASGKFFTKPLEVENGNLLSTHLDRVSDALDDALNGRNGLREDSRETRVLRRTCEKYADDPERVEMDFVDVQRGLSRQMVCGDLPESEENRALSDALANAALDIRATHPEIAENRAVRVEQKIRELPEDARVKLESALPVLEAISDEKLAADFREDIPRLLNDAVGSLQSSSPPLPGLDPANRVGSRVAKISLQLRSKSIVEKIEKSTVYKGLAIVGTISGLVALLIGLIT